MAVNTHRGNNCDDPISRSVHYYIFQQIYQIWCFYHKMHNCYNFSCYDAPLIVHVHVLLYDVVHVPLVGL